MCPSALELLSQHAESNFAEDETRTGLLGLPDALREFTTQRLVQRIADLEEATVRSSCTVLHCL